MTLYQLHIALQGNYPASCMNTAGSSDQLYNLSVTLNDKAPRLNGHFTNFIDSNVSCYFTAKFLKSSKANSQLLMALPHISAAHIYHLPQPTTYP